MFWRRALLLQLLANVALAGDFVIGGGVESDSEDGIALALIGDVAIGADTWLSASYAHTSIDVATDSTLETSYADIGLDHYFDPLGVQFEVAYWGDSDVLSSNDVRASLYYRSDRWRLAGSAEYREFEFEFAPQRLVDLPVRDISFHANGFGLSGRFDVNDTVSLNVSGTTYDYNVPLERADNPGIVSLLSVSRLSLINSLVDYQVGGGVGLSFGEQRWDLDYRNWRSVVDSEQTQSLTIRFLTPVGQRNDLELGIGVDDSESLGSVVFFSAFLYFYGGG